MNPKEFQGVIRTFLISSFKPCNKNQVFNFSTLYTTMPHQKLTNRLTSIIRNAVIFKNGNQRYKYLVLGHDETYFVKEHSDSKRKRKRSDSVL